MKRAKKSSSKYYIAIESWTGKAYVYPNIKAFVSDYIQKFPTRGKQTVDDMIKDLSNEEGPDWAKAFCDTEDRKFLFDGKEELLKAFQKLPYKAQQIDIGRFLSLADPDLHWYKAKMIKKQKT
ncbi:MAG: hypothetical protein K2Q45_03220 [Nitrosomonas sp.]|nr:hypothetical protein [Nitrosomonas sp.]